MEFNTLKLMTNALRLSSLYLILLLALMPASEPAAAADACTQLGTELHNQQTRLTTLQQQIQELDDLNHGIIADGLVLASLVSTPLELEKDVSSARKVLALQKSSLSQPHLPEQFQHCGKPAETWLQQAQQLLKLERQKLALTQPLLEASRARRLALVRSTNQWLIMQNLSLELDSLHPAGEPSPGLQPVKRWISDWRSAMRQWLPVLMQHGTNEEQINASWLQALSIPAPATVIDWSALASGNEADAHPLLLWQDAMEEARNALRVESSRWRNRITRQQGWSGFLTELQHPLAFLLRLGEEMVTAPGNMGDSVTRPFIREYRRAVRNDNLAPLLTFWFAQGVGLVLIFWLLIRLAAVGPRHLANWQQSLIENFPSGVPAQLITALFWIIKPNAAWLIVLTGSALCMYFTEDEWYILSWVGPFGLLYATVRALRIALEWLLSRSFTRSRQFISSPIADQITRDALRASWLVVVNWLSRWLVLATGGGYSYFFIALINVAIWWWILVWLLSRYESNIARFFLYNLRNNSKNPAETAFVTRWWVKLLWPPLFLLAHIYDLVFSLNQKLMVFDRYRAFSVKLLRMRLEAIEEERDEEEAEADAPDQSYSSWVLREPKPEDPLIEAADIEPMLAPIKQWFAERSDDNVLLVVGEQGSGKTTLVKRLPTLWQDTPVKYVAVPPRTLDQASVMAMLRSTLDLESCNSIAELVSQDASIPPQVVIIDAAHNLFLTEVGKLDAYHHFIQCLNAHLDNVFWVVVMHGPSWTYLDCVFNREQRFSNVYRMRKWSPSDIRKFILSRHQGSRRRLRYDELLLSASAGSESSSVRAADSRVFNIIWEQSGGNPLVALHLWLTAARTKDRVVEVGVPEKPSAAALNSLKDDLCFIYASIIIHKALSTSEIKETTNYPEPIVRHALKQGINLGLLYRNGGKRYSVHPVWQSTLSNHLIRKNMLWTL